MVPGTNPVHAAPMNMDTIFQHKGYELRCGARALDSGSYMPTLVVAKHLWPSRPRTLAVTGEGCRSIDEAIASAHAQGLAWVRDFG
jgi:hypothetical protein